MITVPELCGHILAVLKEHGPLTGIELQHHLSMRLGADITLSILFDSTLLNAGSALIERDQIDRCDKTRKWYAKETS